jgi:hypothetical protein
VLFVVLTFMFVSCDVPQFGGRNVGADLVWHDAFVRYLVAKGFSHFYWCLNPSSGDTGGFMLDDWVTVDGSKARVLERTKSSHVAANLYHFKRH